MSHNTKWTQEEVQTLTNLRKKKVKFNHIAMVLGRSPMACQQKAWSLANPEYIKLKNKRKRPTPKKEDNLPFSQAARYIELYRQWEESAKEWKARCEESERSVKELKAELKHAQECMQAIQLNMNQFYNYS